MALLKSSVILNPISGKPEDACIATYHFDTAGAIGSDDMVNASAALAALYGTDLGPMISPVMSRAANAHTIQHAEVTKGSTGAADDVQTAVLASTKFTLANAVTTQGLPSEVACVVSFESDVTGVNEEDGLIRPRSRRRGRTFFGPLSNTMLGFEATTNRVIVATAKRADILTAFTNFQAALASGPGELRWVVYSRMDAVTRPIIKVSVDDAFDTQRRRGEKRVNRESITITPTVLVP